jgi:uncharacterized damage-inducible protein DinB
MEESMEIFFDNYFDRLNELHGDIIHAIEDLPQEALDWVAGEDVPSICVLVTHIAGAERYWIGDVAGGIPSNRDRDAEFRASGLDSAALLDLLNASLAFTKGILEKISLMDLESICISPRTGRRFTVGWSLLHALEHTALHLGHIQIIRQMWEQRETKPEPGSQVL